MIKALVGQLGKAMTCVAMVWATGWKKDDEAEKVDQVVYMC